MRGILGVVLSACLLVGCGGVEETQLETPPLAEQEQEAGACLDGYVLVYSEWRCEDGCNVEYLTCCFYNLCLDEVGRKSCPGGCS
ncbi:hypothetical protein HPC49_00460 [Pyxidicoccus fallax]|uniref:Lipoprotein n=1 Tax=Pyxidicoccus fallax TaxID=394095 RepID=A0A848L4L6_9BACT|nr:hypothetical protein [Pyxidicoccus fallax]NMO13566.1 hypothetical protein [Pyxidicoccus fallax]NPC76726.1 hypothetical protein [Pyxidicoccus fallax]